MEFYFYDFVRCRKPIVKHILSIIETFLACIGKGVLLSLGKVKAQKKRTFRPSFSLNLSF